MTVKPREPIFLFPPQNYRCVKELLLEDGDEVLDMAETPELIRQILEILMHVVHPYPYILEALRNARCYHVGVDPYLWLEEVKGSRNLVRVRPVYGLN